MTANQVRGLMTAIAIVVGAGALGRVSGQVSQPKGDDVLPSLLVEVKGLRAAMEQMAAAGPRVQLVVSRLQLQEGRIAGMVRRLDTVRDSLSTARRDLDRFKGSVQMLESGDKSGAAPDEDSGPMLAGMKREIATAQEAVNRLATEELQLTQDIAAEQARWVEISQRLDELERSLAAKR
jgi:hypothetical protein